MGGVGVVVVLPERCSGGVFGGLFPRPAGGGGFLRWYLNLAPDTTKRSSLHPPSHGHQPKAPPKGVYSAIDPRPQGCIGTVPLQGAQPLSPWRQVPASMVFVPNSNRPPSVLATSSNRLPNRFWGRLWGPFPSNVSLPNPPEPYRG